MIKQIQNEYKGRINFAFRHFPLPQHQNAIIAAQAAEAAGEQGKFFEMGDKLYARQADWETSSNPSPLFSQYAQDLQLDLEKFNKDLAEGKYSDRIQSDKADGASLGVNSTPTFYVSGMKVAGPSYQSLKKLIDEQLQSTPAQ